jgi:hypothetical protein
MEAFISGLLRLGRRLGCVSELDRASYLAGRGRFSRPFVISLPRDAERYARAEALLGELGEEPILFRAVEGARVDPAHTLLRGFERLSASERGCLLSHLCVLALASTHPEPDQFTVVYEDDVTTSLRGDALKKNLVLAAEIADREGASLLHLGKCFETCGAMVHLEQNLYRSSSPYCAHALAIRNSAARALLGTMREGREAVDNLYGKAIKGGTLVGLAFHPALFYQDVLISGSNLRPGAINSYNECLDTRDCAATVCPQCPESPSSPQPEAHRGSSGGGAILVGAILVALATATTIYIVATSRRQSGRRMRRRHSD